MKVGELNRWNSSNAAIRADLVVVLVPDRGRISCLLQCLEPALIEVFILKLSIETLDVTILHSPVELRCYEFHAFVPDS